MLNINEIQELIKAIDHSSIDDFTYEANGTLIKLKKSTANTVVQQAPVQVQTAPVVEAPATPVVQETKVEAAAPVPEKVHAEEAKVDFDYEIVSPMVGTLYRASSPDKDPYVSVGSNVNKDSIVCIVEAMKLFNEIVAEVNGEIVEVLVEDGELVEFGQPLFRVKTK